MSDPVDLGIGGCCLPVVASRLQEVQVAYMNMGRGRVATHVYLERCVRRLVGVVFVGECWVERGGGQIGRAHV